MSPPRNDDLIRLVICINMVILSLVITNLHTCFDITRRYVRFKTASYVTTQFTERLALLNPSSGWLVSKGGLLRVGGETGPRPVGLVHVVITVAKISLVIYINNFIWFY